MFCTARIFAGIFLSLTMALALILSGCAQTMSDYYVTSQTMEQPNPCATISCLLNANNKAGDTMASVLSKNDVPEEALILTASFVEIGDYTRTSDLGRLIPKQLSTRLAAQGYQTVDLGNLDPEMVIRPQDGEFTLTRAFASTYAKEGSYGVLAGTYTVGQGEVYVNARVIRISDNVVVAGYDYALPTNQSVLAMLGLQLARGPYQPLVKPTVWTSLAPVPYKHTNLSREESFPRDSY